MHGLRPGTDADHGVRMVIRQRSKAGAPLQEKEVQRMEAYCLKCRQKREMRNATPTTMKNGKPATTGTCPVCSTKMYRIGKG